jgi:hypothetical protein
VPDHVTPYDRFAFSDVDLERMLAAGEMREELTAYFGGQEHRALTQLARRAIRTAPSPSAPTVIIVPGVMGSQLGLARPAPLPPDILWLDPIDVQLGRLAQLRLPGGAIRPLGVVLFSYFRMKLQLRAAGFAARFHDYDWRLGLEELGRGLAERLRAEPARELAIVAHSMGGLVCRVALGLTPFERLSRVILLGTPNAGSFAPVQALRGTYSVVRKLARLAPGSSAEDLSAGIFNTFPSLYQLLARERCGGEMDLFDATQWPRSGPQPDRQLLVRARGAHGLLAPVDARFVSIAGVAQETVTAVSRHGDDFLYTVTRHGDGTVPAVSAELPGAAQYYAPVSHSDLTRDAAVTAAVVDLLRRGRTRRLVTSFRRASRALAQVSDAQLRRTDVTKVEWASLTPDERRDFLQMLNDSPKLLRVPRRGDRRGRAPAGR